MTLKKSGILAAACAVLTFSSCKEKTEETTTPSYETPSEYNFTNVSYSGQTARLDMMAAMTTYMKTAHTPAAAALDAVKLKGMFSNDGNHFNDADLNSSSKQLKSKTSPDVQADFESYMDAIVLASQSTSMVAASGQAGIITSNDGNSNYLLNANGVELTQIIEKGLMGACFYYQATAIYLGDSKMNVDNETVVPGEGTEMEHHWDEAFGYFGAPTDFPTNVSGIRFWAKYSNKRDGILGTNALLMNALIGGRAAISNGDMDGRNTKIAEVRNEWEIVVASTAVAYLNDVAGYIGTDPGKAHHALSEAYAFIMGLKFGPNSNISTGEIDALLVMLGGDTDPLNANFWSITTTTVEQTRDALAAKFPTIDAVKTTL